MHENDFTSIIGHNGSGKTTLIKIIMGFLKYRKGKIFINGIDSASQEFRKANKSFGYISQGSIATILPVTVKEIIGIAGIGNKHFDKKLYDNVLSTFGIKKLENELYRTLSGGQKQKVNIARCVAQEAEIIILDEPDAFLDPKSQHEIMELIKEVNLSKKISIVMISHDFSIVEKYSDRVFVIENQNVTESDQFSLKTTSRSHDSRNEIKKPPCIGRKHG